MIWKTEHLVCTQCRMGRGVPVERGRLGLLQSWVFLVRFHLPSLILALSRRETSARRCRQTKMAITATKASPHPTWRNCMLRPPRNSHITACCYIQRMQKHPHTQQHHGHNNKPDAQQTKRQPSVLRTYLKKKKKKNFGEIPTRRSSVAAVVYQLSQHCADKKREKEVNIMYPCIRQGARHLTSWITSQHTPMPKYNDSRCKK